MPLTVVVGASGSGKTTFLNDLHKSHKCTYIRQYHNVRPYLQVSKVPNFDPSQLPYWDIYVNEGKDQTIQVGGTMAGEFTAGLSGGQRKLFLFELIYQRTQTQKDLLIVLDEPFAGVTDDFLPFITSRLQSMQSKHNLVVVTNDHVQTLLDMSDTQITVSAIDRTKVKINSEPEGFDRALVLEALSLGKEYKYQGGGAVPDTGKGSSTAMTTTNKAPSSDFEFFWQVEVAGNKGITTVGISSIIFFAMFIATFWNSSPGNESLVLIGGGIITYFAVQPYLLSLADWRNINQEEADALLHSSVEMNRTAKTILTITMALIIDFIYFGCINLVIDTLGDLYFLVAIIFDVAALTFPMIVVALYTSLPFEQVQVLGSLPFLLMIFFSSTFSPGGGVEGLKVLRYLFPRFYFWCELPDVGDLMENCPETRYNLLLMIVTSQLFFLVFFASKLPSYFAGKASNKEHLKRRQELMKDPQFLTLQQQLFGDEMIQRLAQEEIDELGVTSRSVTTNKTTTKHGAKKLGSSVSSSDEEIAQPKSVNHDDGGSEFSA